MLRSLIVSANSTQRRQSRYRLLPKQPQRTANNRTRNRYLVVLATTTTAMSDSAGYTLYAAELDDPMIPPAAGFFYPNPFNPQTALSPVTRLLTSPGQVVTLRLYDIRGHEVYRLGPRPAEDNAPLVWNGTLQNGQAAPSGVYFARVGVGAQVFTRKLVLIR